MLERVVREPEFRIRCLGGFRLVDVRGDADLTPASRKARVLLGYLLIMGKPVGREQLASLLWGDRGDEQARASLRQTIYEVRSLTAGSRLLKIDRDMVSIGGNVATDVAGILAAARSGDLEQLVHCLSEWRGQFFEDMPSIDPSFDAWLDCRRADIRETLIGAASDAVAAAMAAGRSEWSRKAINLLQERDGTHEAVLRMGLRLDHLASDTAALHRRYERFRDLLRLELAAAPSAETQRLFHDLVEKMSRPEIASCEGRNFAADNSGGNVAASSGPCPERSASSPAAPVPGTLGPPVRRRLPGVGSWIAAAGIAASVWLVGVALAWTMWRGASKPESPQREPLLVVVPFQNLSGDPQLQYFSDGMTEEIKGALLRLTQIRVAASVDGARFHGAGATWRMPDATHVLSGSVQRSAGRVHVIAQLAETAHNRIIWSRAYDRTLRETPVLQQDMAVQIADALDMRLSPGALREAQRIDPSAYDHYLRGRDLFLQREDPDAAIAELEISVRLAPRFAKAWSTLAASRYLLASYLWEQDEQRAIALESSARETAQHALMLDPDDGEALGLKAVLTPPGHFLEIDRLLQQALRAQPYDTQLLNWRGGFLMAVGRISEAGDAFQRAYDLDHVTPSIALNLAMALLQSGQFAGAAGILDLGRDYSDQRSVFGLRVEYFLDQRDWSGLAAYLATLPDTLSPREVAFFALCRQTALALSTADSADFPALRARWKNEKQSDPHDAVRFLAGLADPDGARDAVETLTDAERNDSIMTYAKWDVLFAQDLARLRQDPRVPELFAKWGLFDYWRTSGHWPDFCSEPGLPFDCGKEAQEFARPPLGGKRS
jgi:DNA-binding SARP family transcriptional activator/TolB-like protein/tetratricopeptide (TPR) repeat protein